MLKSVNKSFKYVQPFYRLVYGLRLRRTFQSPVFSIQSNLNCKQLFVYRCTSPILRRIKIYSICRTLNNHSFFILNQSCKDSSQTYIYTKVTAHLIDNELKFVTICTSRRNNIIGLPKRLQLIEIDCRHNCHTFGKAISRHECGFILTKETFQQSVVNECN